MNFDFYAFKEVNGKYSQNLFDGSEEIFRSLDLYDQEQLSIYRSYNLVYYIYTRAIKDGYMGYCVVFTGFACNNLNSLFMFFRDVHKDFFNGHLDFSLEEFVKKILKTRSFDNEKDFVPCNTPLDYKKLDMFDNFNIVKTHIGNKDFIFITLSNTRQRPIQKGRRKKPREKKFVEPDFFFSWKGCISRRAYIIRCLLISAVFFFFFCIFDAGKVMWGFIMFACAYLYIVQNTKRAHDFGMDGMSAFVVYMIYGIVQALSVQFLVPGDFETYRQLSSTILGEKFDPTIFVPVILHFFTMAIIKGDPDPDTNEYRKKRP